MDRTQNSPQHWQTGIPTLEARESYERRLGRRLCDECGGGVIFPARERKTLVLDFVDQCHLCIEDG
jgi:hypothetical protein